jgi:hypothetical protein
MKAGRYIATCRNDVPLTKCLSDAPGALRTRTVSDRERWHIDGARVSSP